MIITSVSLYKDVGYMDGAIEVPPISQAVTQAADYTFSNVNPSKDRLFSEFKIPGAYSDLYNVSYLSATYDFNNGNSFHVYGWVDSVAIQSDTEDYPITVISWHVDLWRTYAGSASYGSGMVRKRPQSATMPPQDYPHRYLKVTEVTSIDGSGSYSDTTLVSNFYWLYINHQYNDDGVTYNRWYGFPVDITDTDNSDLYIISDGETTGNAIPISYVLNGTLDEQLGLDPDAINFAGIAPIPPKTVSGIGTSGNPFMMDDVSVIQLGNYYVFDLSIDDFGYPGAWHLIDTIMTNDVVQYTITDFEGNSILTLPWGIEVDCYRYRLIPTSTAITIAICFDRSDRVETMISEHLPYESIEGTVCYINCPSLDINSNAWSSYVYSGAREVASQQLELATESQAVSGLSSMASGALTGALVGSAALPGVGTVIGGIAGAATSLISTGINYAYQSMSYNDSMMEINDYEASHQSSNVLLNGSGLAIINNGSVDIKLVTTTYDDYSIEQRNNDLEIYGCHVSEPMESCQSLINAGGPIQIDNLVVTGDIPVQAKQYIKQRLASGVRII